jgi:hypothetical protein
VFVLLEFSSPSRRIFIGSHSLPPSLVRRIGPSVSKPKELPPRIWYNCRQPGHYANECPNPRKIKPEQQTQNPGVAKGNRDKKPTIQVKQGQLNFTGDFLSESIPPYYGLLMVKLYSILAF